MDTLATAFFINQEGWADKLAKTLGNMATNAGLFNLIVEEMMKRFWFVTILALTAMTLAGCGGGSATPTSSGSTYTSKVLATSYQGALSASDQLMLGTMRLEGTDQAVTPEQAKSLLPLWQMLQGGALKVETERNAVYAQIEAQMTPAQLEAIAAMQLTQESLTQAAPPGSGPFGDMSDEQRAAMQATAQAGGGQAPFGDMSDEQRAAMRATAQAGGMPAGSGGGQGQFGNMTDEQRAAMRATMEAGGGWPGRGAGGTPGAAPRQGSFLLNSLIRLLSQRAGLETVPNRAATRVSTPSSTPTTP